MSGEPPGQARRSCAAEYPMRIDTRSYLALALIASTGLTALAAPPPPVTALTYRPNGAHLAVGLRDEVLLLDAAGAVVGRILGQSGPVTALGWSRDGTRLAVASGAAGKSGEVRLYACPANGPAPTKPEKTIAAHADRIHDLA